MSTSVLERKPGNQDGFNPQTQFTLVSEPLPDVMMQLGFLSRHRPDIAERIATIAQTAPSVAEAFPSRFARGISLAQECLLGSSAYAANRYFSDDGYVNIRLPLRVITSAALPLRLDTHGEDIDTIIAGVDTVMLTISKLAHLRSTNSLKTVLAVDSPDYSYFRYLNPGLQRLMTYVRSRGGYNRNPSFEYGRGGFVEASIGHIVDLSGNAAGQLPELGPHQRNGSDNRVSVRLDREGIDPELRNLVAFTHDPTVTRGTLSHDFGSVSGDESWIGTKIGRFLAWGDLLRSDGEGYATGLNHVTRHFAEEDGRADVFAVEAEAFRKELLDYRVTSEREIREALSGMTMSTFH